MLRIVLLTFSTLFLFLLGFVSYIEFGIWALYIVFGLAIAFSALIQFLRIKQNAKRNLIIMFALVFIATIGAFLLGERFGVVMLDVITKSR